MVMIRSSWVTRSVAPASIINAASIGAKSSGINTVVSVSDSLSIPKNGMQRSTNNKGRDMAITSTSKNLMSARNTAIDVKKNSILVLVRPTNKTDITLSEKTASCASILVPISHHSIFDSSVNSSAWSAPKSAFANR